MTPEDEEFERIAQRQLAALKKSTKATTEDAAVRAVHKVMAEFDTPLTLNGVALYPRQQPLTDERIGQIIEDCKITLVNYCSDDKQIEFARSIEAAHGIKGEA